MAHFNYAGFNRSGFNRPRRLTRFIDREPIRHSERVSAVIGAPFFIDRIRIAHRERLDSKSIDYVMFINFERHHSEKLDATPLDYSVFVNRSAIRHKENIAADIHLGAVIHRIVNHSEALDGDIHIGMFIRRSIEHSENLGNITHLGTFVNFERSHYEAVNAMVSIGLRRYLIFTLDTEIPPGGEVRIDSNNFTVLLTYQGETINIRPRFSGDWIHFDRDTTRLIINNQGVDVLTGDVTYHDRWI